MQRNNNFPERLMSGKVSVSEFAQGSVRRLVLTSVLERLPKDLRSEVPTDVGLGSLTSFLRQAPEDIRDDVLGELGETILVRLPHDVFVTPLGQHLCREATAFIKAVRAPEPRGLRTRSIS